MVTVVAVVLVVVLVVQEQQTPEVEIMLPMAGRAVFMAAVAVVILLADSTEPTSLGQFALFTPVILVRSHQLAQEIYNESVH
jgi:hypothetical protein